MTTGATLPLQARDCRERGVLASSGNNGPSTGVTWLRRDLGTVWPDGAWVRPLHGLSLARGVRSG